MPPNQVKKLYTFLLYCTKILSIICESSKELLKMKNSKSGLTPSTWLLRGDFSQRCDHGITFHHLLC